MNYLKLLRPQQWIKNSFVFAALFFAKELFIVEKLTACFYVFIAFCLVASSVYVFNDILDRKVDALHEKKKTRPLAAGKVSPKKAFAFSFLLLLIGGIFSWFLVPKAIPLLGLYWVLNMGYSLYLKHLAIFDILLVSSFYLIRVVVGGVVTDTLISNWLILCILFGALLLILGKRKIEFSHANKRQVLYTCNAALIDHLLMVAGTLVLISYSLYTILGVNSPLMVYSIFFVLLGVFRYFFVLFTSNQAEYPEKIIFSDKIILGSILGWMGFVYFIFY